MPSSKSFKFGLVNGVECVSRTGESCVFEDGNFYFYPKDSDTSCRKMTIGESFQNNGGGWGGFVGLKHEYFVYCGSKFPEIAIAKFNKKKGKWEDVGGKQFDSDETEAENSFFEGIWFTTEGPKLIFKPKKEYEKELMAEIKGKKTKKYIQVDLSTFHITGVTEKEFRNLRVHKAGANSEMPGDFYESSSEATLCYDSSEELNSPLENPPRSVSLQEVLYSMWQKLIGIEEILASERFGDRN